MEGVAETSKAPSNEGAFFIFGAGQKGAPSVVSESAQLSQHAGSCFFKVLCLDSENTLKPYHNGFEVRSYSYRCVFLVA